MNKLGDFEIVLDSNLDAIEIQRILLKNNYNVMVTKDDTHYIIYGILGDKKDIIFKKESSKQKIQLNENK